MNVIPEPLGIKQLEKSLKSINESINLPGKLLSYDGW